MPIRFHPIRSITSPFHLSTGSDRDQSERTGIALAATSMQTFTFQRSSKALSVHVDGCNISVSSAVLRGVRPTPKHHARMERAAAAPRIKRRHISPRVDRQEPSIASSLEDTRLAIRQFEFGMRNRTKIQQSQMKTMKSGFLSDFSHRTRSVGVTQIAHLELPPKCSAAPDPTRSLTIISCRPIRVRHPYLSKDSGSIPSLSDRPRSLPNIAN